jgi:hypothetical protein
VGLQTFQMLLNVVSALPALSFVELMRRQGLHLDSY